MSEEFTSIFSREHGRPSAGGLRSQEILFSGDSAVDQNALDDFAAAYDRMHRWGNIKAGGKILYVGVENFPFPIPLMQNASGRWYFDSDSGADEILARHIGRNELVAIAAVGALAKAGQQYFSQNHPGGQVKQYARKFVSSPGTQNGLYWPAAPGEMPSPLGQLGDFAQAAGYTKPGENPQSFIGYYFRILTKQGNTAKGGAKDYLVNGAMTGGFAILAYPADYRNTGIISFIVGDDGVVYQKDLGERTASCSRNHNIQPGRWLEARDHRMTSISACRSRHPNRPAKGGKAASGLRPGRLMNKRAYCLSRRLLETRSFSSGASSSGPTLTVNLLILPVNLNGTW